MTTETLKGLTTSQLEWLRDLRLTGADSLLVEKEMKRRANILGGDRGVLAGRRAMTPKPQRAQRSATAPLPSERRPQCPSDLAARVTRMRRGMRLVKKHAQR